jgi:hypothetical protein
MKLKALVAFAVWVVLSTFVGWGLALAVELVFASLERPSPLPPPSSWWVRGAVIVFAVAVSAAIARHSVGEQQVWKVCGVAAAVLVVALVGGYARHVSDENSYLKALPEQARAVDDATLLADGHAACDWISHRHWGEPSGQGTENTPFQPFYARGHISWYGSNSTERLYVSYVRGLEAQPGPMKLKDRLTSQVSVVAWLRLCPFQQWVHRPVWAGSSG